MRISRLFVDSDLCVGSTIDITANRGHYVKHVLRLKTGHNITLFNGLDATDYIARLEIINKSVKATPFSMTRKLNDSTLASTIIQAVGKPEHIDFLVQKSTELGVHNLIFFNAQRTQTIIRGNRLDKKIARWRDIAINACEQCNRNTIPTISFQQDLPSVLSQLSSANRIMLDFIGSPLEQIRTKMDPQLGFQLLIGPEGGFEEKEVRLANDSGFNTCLLGPRILRMETAALSILCLVQHYFGDLR